MSRLGLQDREDLAAAIDVVAQRDAVDAGGDQLVVDRRASGPSRRRRSRRWRRPGRALRSIRSPGTAWLTDLPPGLADDVADQQESHVQVFLAG